MTTALRWIIRRWWAAVILVLAGRLWQVSRTEPTNGLAQRGPAFHVVGKDSAVVSTEPIILRAPNLPERILKTETAKRYDAEFKKLLEENKAMARALADERAKPERVTVVRAETEGDSLRFQFGEAIEHPAFSLNVVAPETYELKLHPRKYRLSLVETQDRGPVYAELTDLTLGRTIPVTDFTTRRLAEGWHARWFRFGLGAGFSSGTDGAVGLHGSASISPLVFSRGDTRLALFRFDVDRHRAALEVVRWSN